MAIDRESIIEGAEFGYGVPIGSHFAPHHPDYIDLTDIYAFDPDAAAAMLLEAGYENLELVMKVPPIAYARRSAEIIAF